MSIFPQKNWGSPAGIGNFNAPLNFCAPARCIINVSILLIKYMSKHYISYVNLIYNAKIFEKKRKIIKRRKINFFGKNSIFCGF